MPPIRVLLPVDAVAMAQAAKQDIYGNTAGRDEAEGSVLQAASDRVADLLTTWCADDPSDHPETGVAFAPAPRTGKAESLLTRQPNVQPHITRQYEAQCRKLAVVLPTSDAPGTAAEHRRRRQRQDPNTLRHWTTRPPPCHYPAATLPARSWLAAPRERRRGWVRPQKQAPQQPRRRGAPPPPQAAAAGSTPGSQLLDNPPTVTGPRVKNPASAPRALRAQEVDPPAPEGGGRARAAVWGGVENAGSPVSAPGCEDGSDAGVSPLPACLYATRGAADGPVVAFPQGEPPAAGAAGCHGGGRGVLPPVRAPGQRVEDDGCALPDDLANTPWLDLLANGDGATWWGLTDPFIDVSLGLAPANAMPRRRHRALARWDAGLSPQSRYATQGIGPLSTYLALVRGEKNRSPKSGAALRRLTKRFSATETTRLAKMWTRLKGPQKTWNESAGTCTSNLAPAC
ncbi:hypothetical protein DIPPA_08528 [Diplonema papillatum]|nr:hypothetical protein DIPPA_08528 [Diplonema papillatum]